MKVGKLGWLVAMFLSGGMAIAQGTADDYRRAYALKESSVRIKFSIPMSIRNG